MAGVAIVAKDCGTFQYKVVPNFFIQDDNATDPASAGPVPPSFGLIDNSTNRWATFQQSITQLKKDAPRGTSYKVFFFGRHGEGWHNVAEAFYGTAAWDENWSKLNGNGSITWGPDAKLTPKGIGQAQAVNQIWKLQITEGVPLPQQYYSSPLSRAASTLNITFKDISLEGRHAERPLIMENLREVMGVHTCDKRDTKSYLRTTYPQYRIEPGFTEQDELWKPDVRETNAERDARVRKALDTIFSTDDSTYISVTAHSGAIAAILRNLGHRPYSLPTGGVIPVVVKATVS